MNYTQNIKIEQVKESTLVVGIDIGSQTHFARAFDWRGRELTKKVFSFSSSLEGFINFHDWTKQICERNGKTDVLLGCEPTGHYWFTFEKYVREHGMKLAFVNPYHVKKSKEMDDNSPKKTDRKEALLRLAKRKGFLVRKDVESELGVSQATAILLLRDMVENGLLVKEGSGRFLKYRAAE